MTEHKEVEIKSQIDKIFNKYKRNFLKLPRQARLTEYEKAIGFTEETRVGSKQFSNQLGYFMEDIYNISSKFNKISKNFTRSKGSNDGENEGEFFECKNRYDTMKGSMAYTEIKTRLDKSISENRDFKLLILWDLDSKNRSIPLHEGVGLKLIKNIPNYNPEKHRWISGDRIYQYLFDKEWKTVRDYILYLLSTIKIIPL